MLLVRRFAKAIERAPCFVKVVGLPVEDWETYLDELTKDFKLVLHERSTYICLQTETETEARDLIKLLHNHTMPETKTTLRAIPLIADEEEEWNHRLFHVRADFAIEPESSDIMSEEPISSSDEEEAEEQIPQLNPPSKSST
jgi:hypothetical protein